MMISSMQSPLVLMLLGLLLLGGFWQQHSYAIESTTSNQQQDGITVGSTADPQVSCANNSCHIGTWMANDTVDYEVQLASEVDTSWWCPTGFHLKNRVRVCAQKSCLWIAPVPDGNRSTDNGQDKALVCLPPSKEYNTCRKIPLFPNQYVVKEENTNIWIPKMNITIPLGDFVILESSVACICMNRIEDSKVPLTPPPTTMKSWYTEEFVNSISPACMPFRVPRKDFVMLSNGAALMLNGTASLKPTFYDTNNLTTAMQNVCYELSTQFLECKPKGQLFEDDYDIMPNMAIKVHVLGALQVEVVHLLGTYMFIIGDGRVAYCLPSDPMAITDEKRYLYGAAFILSSIFLFLALLAHLFLPHINYHAKALLCHILSMFIMYLSLSIQFFAPLYHWNNAACYIFFAITYVASLGAFFWLSVLAFDLWRVFANMRGTILPGSNDKKRRKFLLQCLYSWGIPSLLCIFVLIIEWNEDLQIDLNIVMQVKDVCWFLNEKPLMIFLYLPIIIILILNAVFFTLTVLNLRQASKGTDVLNKKVSRQLFRVFVKLFVVMGLFWFAEVISWLLNIDQRWSYATDLINALQGLAIFLVYIWKSTTLTAIKNKLGYGEGSQETQSSSSSQHNNRKVSEVSMTSVSRRGPEGHTISQHQNGVYRQRNSEC